MSVPASRSPRYVGETRCRAVCFNEADPGPASRDPDTHDTADFAAAGKDRQLPVDSDTDVVERSGRPPRPLGVHPGDLALVIVGGAVGVAARDVATRIAMPGLTEPGITVIVNVAGCLLLGLLLETLASRGRRRTTRLLAGTGALGGFTSYSTFAVDVYQMLESGRLFSALGYGLGSVLAGVLAAAAGIWIGAALHRRSAGRR